MRAGCLLLLLALLPLSASASAAPAAAETITVTDVVGRTVSVNAPVQRVLLGEGARCTSSPRSSPASCDGQLG